VVPIELESTVRNQTLIYELTKKVERHAEMLKFTMPDLLYWVEYTYRFNVGHLIPDYDHAGWIRCYHLDQLAFFTSIIFALAYTLALVCNRAGRPPKQREKTE
jgi:hypothetical protein